MIMGADRMKEFKKVKIIGEGTYGIVYKSIDSNDDSIVAIKEIKFENSDEGVPSTALREISILKTLSHPNIVQLKEVIYSKENFTEHLNLIFEYIDTDLHQLLINPDKELTPESRRHIFRQIVEGVTYFHQHGFIHRDIKPSNILVTDDHQVKIADLGLSRMFTFPLRDYTHEVCSLFYRPPEILLGQKKYGSSLDIWSLGCTFGEMITKKPILAGDSEIGQLFKIFELTGTPTETEWQGLHALPDFSKRFPKFKKPDWRSLFPQALVIEVQFLEYILQLDPKLRPLAEDILAHPYFQAELNEPVHQAQQGAD